MPRSRIICPNAMESLVTLLERDIPGAGGIWTLFRVGKRFWGKIRGTTIPSTDVRWICGTDLPINLMRILAFTMAAKCGGENDPQRATQLRQRIQQIQMWGYPCRLITREEMLTFEPHLHPGTVVAASFSDADIHVETDRFIGVCLQRACERGAVVHQQTSVTGFVIRNGSVAAVKTTDAEFPCDVVVLASGVQTTELASLAHTHIPQQRSPGIVIKTHAVCSGFTQRRGHSRGSDG